MVFVLNSTYSPLGDQPQAIAKLTSGIRAGQKDQVLLGVTGSGKTYTIAQVIKETNLPTLIISHNKTLAGQLYQEFREFFPSNAVSYFVSYYDFYQPEAYIPSSNTYIEKEAEINELIDKLRLKATSNILERDDVIVVSSVSCIYNIGKPQDYESYTKKMLVGDMIRSRKEFVVELIQLQYTQSQFDFKRSTFRDRGEHIDIYLSYEDAALRITFDGNTITGLSLIDPLTGRVDKKVDEYVLYPAKHFLTGGKNWEAVYKEIMNDMQIQVDKFTREKKLVEADRIERRVKHDLELLQEVGYVNGIENYSRYFDGRAPGEAPNSLLGYFQYKYGDNWLLVVDESHMTVPQIRGMYNGDFSRKKNLVDFGFRLPAAFDNRPLRFEEFLSKVHKTIYVSATPADWEVEKSEGRIVEQLVRPTGIPDPEITIRPTKNQIQDLVREIEIRAKKKERTLVTTLTKRIAEDLTLYLKEKGVKAHYLHSDVLTLERSDILENLRKGTFDALIGINLLREGLDLPEVTLVAILDADREGFLRSRTALVQTMGRAARNDKGHVIMYTDKMTNSINAAIDEVRRRRAYQLEYNKKHNITPRTIIKTIREKLVLGTEADLEFYLGGKNKAYSFEGIDDLSPELLTGYDKKKLIARLKRQMKHEAESLNFELAAKLRDKIRQIEKP